MKRIRENIIENLEWDSILNKKKNGILSSMLTCCVSKKMDDRKEHRALNCIIYRDDGIWDLKKRMKQIRWIQITAIFFGVFNTLLADCEVNIFREKHFSEVKMKDM